MHEESWLLNQEEWEHDSRHFRDRISNISDFRTRRDLYKLYTGLDVLHLEIIREENQCKVNRRRSDKHIKLIEDYYIARQNFIEQITLGLLCL